MNDKNSQKEEDILFIPDLPIKGFNEKLKFEDYAISEEVLMPLRELFADEEMSAEEMIKMIKGKK